jgi:hypothetical protein
MIDEQVFKRITTLSDPHMEVIHDAITAAFPDNDRARMFHSLARQRLAGLE